MTVSKCATRATAAAGALAIVVLMAQPIFAQKAFLKKVKEMYPTLDKKIANCGLCHTVNKEKKEHPDKKNLNVYGKELQSEPLMKPALDQKDEDEHKFTDEELKAVEAAIKAVGPKDSDSDGATNEEELALSTNPGDPASTPAKEALEKYRAEHKK
jgi:hypothetical protein